MMYTRENLKKLTVKQLLEIAKDLNIKGRHEMRKVELIEAIVQKQEGIKKIDEKIELEDGPKNYSGIIENDLTKEEVWEEGNSEVVVNKKSKQEYIENAKVGTIIAFKVNNAKTLSGKIEEIRKFDFLVCTKTGVRFTVRKKNVIWVKTGQRWPKAVYLALKGVINGHQTNNS